jgi:anti-anti-sigma factor
MPRPPPFTHFAVLAEHRGGVARLRASGEIDIATAPQLQDALGIVEALDPSTIIVDLREVSFMDSTGIHALLQAHGLAMENGQMLLVVNGTSGVQNALEITGADRVLQVGTGRHELALSEDEGGEAWAPILLPGIDPA